MNTKRMLFGLCLAWVAVTSNASAQHVIDIAKEWRFTTDPEAVGERQHWAAVDFDDGAWATLNAGMRWEDQGIAEYDGHAWYRKWVTVPDGWLTRPVYLAFGGINDCATVYVNGKKAATLGFYEDSKNRESVARAFQAVDITPYVEVGADNLTTKSGTKALIALDVFDWGKSGGLWVLPCALTLNPESMSAVEATCAIDYAARELLVRVLQVNSQTHPLDGEYQITVTADGGTAPVLERRIPIAADALPTECAFPLSYSPDAVTYTVDVTAVSPEGVQLEDVAARTKVLWPARVVRGATYADAVPLNNFVCQLFDDECGSEAETIGFTNPKAGWVFFSLSRPDAMPDRGRLFLDDEKARLALRPYWRTGAMESMRRLDAGRHSVRVEHAEGRRLEVRSIPELLFCFYPPVLDVPEHGPFGLDFFERYVFPTVNTLVKELDPDPFEHGGRPYTALNEPDAVVKQWVRDGREWIVREPLPGLGEGLNKRPPVLAEDVYAVWRDKPGSTHPLSSGIIIDEFSNVWAEQFDEWTAALDRFSQYPAWGNRRFYAWVGEIFVHPPGVPFQEVIKKYDHRLVWENYLSEGASEIATRIYVIEKLASTMQAWQKQQPDISRYLLMCPGIFSAIPATLGKNPHADFSVFLDWQFRLMATHPCHANLAGVIPWTAQYADTDVLQWTYRLMRHYCIEGNTEPLTSDPYELRHIENGDFIHGLEGWTVDAAEEGGVGPDRIEDFGWIEGRYWKTATGDSLVRMTRGAQGGNTLGQTIRGLEPGRRYVAKLLALDVAHWTHREKAGIALRIGGANPVPEHSFHALVESHESGAVAACDRQQALINYIRVVFDAASETAELTITDDVPHGLPGQDLGCNFVEVQPWRWED
ncbi:MAG: hypothetical protein GY851_19075 [bacterium]|nr:hypothetical protein [bacterium]